MNTNFYGYDGHGSTRLLLNPAGVISDIYVYDAYGTVITNTVSTLNNYRYCGEQWDPDLGFYYLRARYVSPGTGRFWTMDSYEGNTQDPHSLHKYLYCHGHPVDGCDPPGHMNLSETAAVTGIIGILAASSITYLADVSIGKHLSTKGAIPDAIFLNIGGGGAYRGFTAGVNAMIYYEFKSRAAYLLVSGEVGIAPGSIFKKQGGWGYLASVGLAFNANGASDFSGWGFTATWPAAMGKTVLPKKLTGWFNFLTTLAARTSTGTQLSKRSGVIQYGYSTSRSAYISYGLYFNAFSATGGFTSDPIPLADIPNEIEMMLDEATRLRQNFNGGLPIPAG